MKQTIPSQRTKRYRTNYESDFFGDIVRAFNIDLFHKKSRVITSKKLQPHTIAGDGEGEIENLTPPSDFHTASIDDGVEVKTKLWAVADDMVIRSEDNALFEKDDSDQLGETDTGSDILSVADEEGDPIDVISLVIPTNNVGSQQDRAVGNVAGNTKRAQSFINVGGPLHRIDFELKAEGSPTDNLILKVQEDDNGEPSGTDLGTVSISLSGAPDTFNDIDLTFSPTVQLDIDKKYWVVAERDGALDNTNYPIIRTRQNLSPNPYPDGEFFTFDGTNWSETAHNDWEVSFQLRFPEAEERIYVTTKNDILFLNEEDGVWQSLWRGIVAQEELNGDYPRILKNLGAGGTLIIGNDNKVHTVIATANNPTEANENRLVFDPTHFVAWIVITSSAVFIGMNHKEGELLPSRIIHYEPFNERTRIFKIREGATVGFNADDNCHIIDKSGQIRAFTGGGFSKYEALPPYYEGNKITLPHRNGIQEKDGVIKILWQGQYPHPAGIWRIDDWNNPNARNLYHSQSLTFSNEFGAYDIASLRALYDTDEVYIGASIFDGVLEEAKGVFSSLGEETEVRANFRTSKFTSSEVDTQWQKVFAKFDIGDIKLKYRTKELDFTDEFTGTWTGQNIFTSDTAGLISAVDSGDIAVGDEITIRKGSGAGLLAHIQAIGGDESAIKTITLKESITGLTSGSMTFSAERWKEVANKEMIGGNPTDWLQVKAELRGAEVHELQIGRKENATIQQ